MLKRWGSASISDLPSQVISRFSPRMRKDLSIGTAIAADGGLQKDEKPWKAPTDSLRVVSEDIAPGKHLHLIPFPQPFTDFCTFLERSSKADVIHFFRDVATELESKRQLRDFHMKVRNTQTSFCIEVFYGDQKRGPQELPPGACISCFPRAPLFPGLQPEIKAGECILTQYSDQPYVHCCLDAKARPGFIITPLRHVERMSELGDDELFALWSVAVRALRNESLPFTSMILNHGTYRNLPHLHLKVWVDKELHRRARLGWSKQRASLWERLIELNEARPKRQQRRPSFQSHKYKN